MAKRDVSKLHHKLEKQKFKGNICKKVLAFEKNNGHLTVKFFSKDNSSPAEDEQESYLFNEHQVAISNLAVSLDSADVCPRIDNHIGKAEFNQYLHQIYNPYYVAVAIRDCPAVFVLGQQTKTAH